MKHRPAPRPINFKRPLPKHLRNDPQVIKWSKRLLGDRNARPTDLSEEQLAFVLVEVAKRRAQRGEEPKSWLDPDLLVKAMAETTPKLAAPRLERQSLVDDLALMFSQPEMRSFWDSWWGRCASKGPQPDFTTGNALAAVMGMSGISAHADDCYAELTGNPAMWQLIERLNGATKPVRPLSYQNALKQLPRLNCHDLAVATNIAMVKALRGLYPDAGVGERLMIDGMGLPAWCEQAPKGEDIDQEQKRRRFCPHAGARAYTHTANGKQGFRGAATTTVLTQSRFWRGYYVVGIADQVSGLMLSWMTMDAAEDEAGAIVPLLSDLYRHWPDCAAEVIVGDSAWDEDNWCRVCEVDYGLHPVFRLHRADEVPKVNGFTRDGAIKEITTHGQLVCSQHATSLPMKSAEAPRRADPQTGEPFVAGRSTDERRFRVRGSCRKGCGDVGLRMQADWSRLTHYPHHGAGSGAIKWRYAMRQALLTRLNGMEAIWLRLQGGKKLGTADADRTRIRDKDAHDLILDLAMLSMSAASLADHRRERGVSVPPLPPASAGASDAAAPRAARTAEAATVPAPSPHARCGDSRTRARGAGIPRTSTGGALTSEMVLDVYAALCE